LEAKQRGETDGNFWNNEEDDVYAELIEK